MSCDSKFQVTKVTKFRCSVVHKNSDSAYKIRSLCFVLAVSSVFMSGCAVPYRVDVRAASAKPGVYYLIAEGAPFDDHSAITHSWHKRALRLCPNGYDGVVNPQSHTTDHRRTTQITGYIRCK